MTSTTKLTIKDIKDELDTLGVPYTSKLRKAELLALLQDISVEETGAVLYSPPRTRRRATMAATELQTAAANLLKSEKSPLNHASAVLEDLEEDANQSEEVSVDVNITKEVLEIEEHAVSTDPSSSEVTESDSDSFAHLKKYDVDPTPVQPKRRKSERLAQKKHDACSGALFSDNEEVENIDTVSETSSQAEQVKSRRSLLFKIFLFAILFAVISNLLAFLFIKYPHEVETMKNRVLNVFQISGPGLKGED